jgi:hypothetical protein
MLFLQIDKRNQPPRGDFALASSKPANTKHKIQNTIKIIKTYGRA